MAKRIQNRIAESRYTLPVAVLFSIAVWLLCGLLSQQWWMQFACFALTTFLIIQLNNNCSLIRIYSRSVSSAFIVMSCVACFLFPSMEGAIAQLCFAASLLTLFQTYQDKQTTGWAFYTYVCLSLGSLVNVYMLWLIPCYWLIQFFFIYSLGGRTFFASILGLLLPYWFMSTWVLWRYDGNMMPFIEHFMPLGDIQAPTGHLELSIPQILTFVFVFAMTLTGTIHYLNTSYNDRIRTRQFFYTLIFFDFIVMLLLIVQPRHYDLLMHIMIVLTCPLIGHFVALTYTRITNIAFYVIIISAFVLTCLHVCISSSIF